MRTRAAFPAFGRARQSCCIPPLAMTQRPADLKQIEQGQSHCPTTILRPDPTRACCSGVIGHAAAAASDDAMRTTRGTGQAEAGGDTRANKSTQWSGRHRFVPPADHAELTGPLLPSALLCCLCLQPRPSMSSARRRRTETSQWRSGRRQQHGTQSAVHAGRGPSLQLRCALTLAPSAFARRCVLL